MGWSLEEVKGKQISEFIHPDFLPVLKKNFPGLLKNGKVEDVRFDFITRSGKSVPVLLNGNIEIKDGHKFTHCIFKDVTKRISLEQKIQEQGYLLKKILSNLDTAIYIWDFEINKLVFSNANGFLGYSKKEIIIQGSLTKFIHEEDKMRVENHWKLLGEDTETNMKPIVYRVMDKSGVYQWVENKFFEFAKNKDRKITSVIVTAEIITGLFKLKEEIKTSEDNFKRVLDSTADGIVKLNTKGKIVYFNQSLLDNSGYTNDELLGKHFTKIPGVSMKDIPQFTRMFSDLIRGKSIKSYDITWKTKDGVSVESEIRISRVKEKGKTTGIIVVSRDVTERNKLIRELQNSRVELRGLAEHMENIREEERAMLAREIHDELGQSLTAVKFDLMFLAKELKVPLKQVNLDRTLKTLEDTIDLSKQLGAKLRPGIIDDLGLGPAIEWLIKNFQRRTLVELDMEITADANEIDRRKSITVFRIIQEAITNIMRHSCATATEVKFRETQPGKYEFYIRDNGVGFNPSKVNRSKCFGLMGMEERARLIDCQVRVESSPGNGTKVSIII